MSTSLASVARAVFDAARPDALISPAAADAILETLVPLPRRLARIFGFEVRLLDDDRTDVFLRIEPEQEGRATLAGSGRFTLDERMRAHPGWRPLVDLARAWERGTGAAWRDVRQLWLELDVPSRPNGIVTPGFVFWHPRPDGDDSPDAARVPVERHLATTRGCAEIVHGVAPAPLALDHLRLALTALPGRAEVFSIGLGIERPPHAIRLCLKHLRHGEHAPYLAALGVPHVADVAPLLAELAPIVDSIQLCFDVGATLGPTIHLELRHAPATGPRLRPLLDWLVARGLAGASKADALVAWLGAPLVLQLEGETRRRNFLRKLSHVKLAWTPGRPLEAKAYFGIWETYTRWHELAA